MLVYRTIAKKVFWEFDSIIMQNLSDILPLFCTPTWPSHHVNENKESGHCFVALALSLPSRALRNRPKTLVINIYEIKMLEFCFPKQLSSMNLFVAEAQSSGPTMGGEDMVRELERLQVRLQEREDAIQCAICMERDKTVVFLCGHMACKICSDRLQICHICRVEIQNRVQVYRWPTREVRSMCTRRETTFILSP